MKYKAGVWKIKDFQQKGKYILLPLPLPPLILFKQFLMSVKRPFKERINSLIGRDIWTFWPLSGPKIHLIVWDIPQQLKTSLFHFIRGITVWRGVETLFITSTSPKWHFLLMFGTWLFSEVQLCDSCLAKKHQWTNLLFCCCRRSDTEFIQTEACCFFRTSRLYTAPLIYQKCIWCNNAGTHVLFKGNRRRKFVFR